MPGIPPFINVQLDHSSASQGSYPESLPLLLTSENLHKRAHHKKGGFSTTSFLGQRLTIVILGLLFVTALFSGFLSKKMSHHPSHLTYMKGPCPDFIGRQWYLDILSKDLLQHQNFKEPLSALKIKVLWGKGGLGKSELAREFAHRFRSSFSLVWTFYCDSKEHVDQGYLELAERLGISSSIESMETIKENVHFHLENHSFDLPWLLIFDNVEQEFSPPERGGVVLVTSQKQILNPEFRLEVEPFSDEESLELLEKITHEKRGIAMEQLVGDLEGIPLLIYYAAHYIKATPGCTVMEYQRLFAERLHEKQGPLWIEMDVNRRYFKSLAASWQFPLKSLEKEHPLALQWLFVCSYLYPEYICEEWIDDWLADQGKKPTEIERKELLKALQTYGVIYYDRDTKTFSLHRFFQYMIRESRKNQSKEFLTQVVSLLAKHAHEYQYTECSSWKQGQLWYLHACAVRKWLNKEQLLFSKEDKLKEIHFYEGIGNWCDGNNHFQEALGTYEKILELQKSNFETNSAEIANTYTRIAKMLDILSRPTEALQACEKAKRVNSDLTGKQALVYAYTLFTKGHILCRIERNEEALKYHRQALQIRLSNLGCSSEDPENSFDQIKAYANEAAKKIEYLQKIGEHQQALILQRQIVDIGKSLFNICHCLLKIDQPKHALEIADTILETYPPTLDTKHPYLAWIIVKKACCIQALGNYREALKLFREALSMLIALRGENHIDLADCWNSIGQCYLQMGALKEARKAFKKSLHLGLRNEGKMYYISLEARNGIGWSYIGEKKIKKGLKCLLTELRISATVYRDTPKMMSILENFYTLLQEASTDIQSSDAIFHAAAEAYTISTEALGKNHPITQSFSWKTPSEPALTCGH